MDILWQSAMAKFGKHVLIMKMVLWTKVLVTHKSSKKKRDNYVIKPENEELSYIEN